MERAAHAMTVVAAAFLAGLAGPAAPSAPGGPSQVIAARGLPSSTSQGPLPGPGQPWTASKAPLPAGAPASAAVTLPGLACPSVLVCVAVGDYLDSSGSGQGLLLAGHGSSWSAVQAPLPAGAATSPGQQGPAVTLEFVACPSASACVAVGGYTDSSGTQQGLLLAGHGSSWTATRAPLPAGAAANPNAYLPDVACLSATMCVAVGSYTDSSGTQQGLLLAGHGSSWTATRAPLPTTAATAASLSGVACVSAARCAAAGMYTSSSGRPQGLLLAGHGSSWTATRAPLPAGAAASVDANIPGHGLACPSAVSCVAVGSYLGTSGYTQGLLLAGHGSSWTATRAPLPVGAKAGWLASVACPSAASCVAAGQYYDSAGNWLGLLLAGHGPAWAATEAPLPAGAAASPNPWFPGVACPSASTCVAAGYYTDTSGYPQGTLLTS